MKHWLNVGEGAEYAGLSRDTIYTACERKELRHVRVGGKRSIRLKPEWIDAWLERHASGVQEWSEESQTGNNESRQFPRIHDPTLRVTPYRYQKIHSGKFLLGRHCGTSPPKRANRQFDCVEKSCYRRVVQLHTMSTIRQRDDGIND
jgi:excisionase family DNA binding protein